MKLATKDCRWSTYLHYKQAGTIEFSRREETESIPNN